MSNTIKKSLLAVLSFLLILACGIGVMTYNPVQAATSPIISTVEAAEANVTTEDNSGLRFTANVNGASYRALLRQYGEEKVDAGMLIVPTNIVTAANAESKEFTFEGMAQVEELNGFTYHVIAEKFKANDDDSYEFAVTVKEIAEKNYVRDYSARAFVKVAVSELETVDGVDNSAFVKEGDVFYAYADFNVETARNVYEVAKEAIEEGTLEDSAPIAKKFMDKIADVKYDNATSSVVIANKSENYTSPFTVEKDGFGNFIVNGKGVNPVGMLYNGESKTEYTFTDTTNVVTVNTMLSQEAKFTGGNTVSLQSAQVNGVSSKNNLVSVAEYLGYIAINGSYGVGTYITTTFTGNNMPQIMFFSNVIDGDLTGVRYDDNTRQGLIAMNGIVGYGDRYHDTNVWKVCGPNRISTSDYTNKYYLALAKLAVDTANAESDYSLLTQDGLNADTSETVYEYTVGTYLNESDHVVYEVLLRNSDTRAIIYHEELELRNNAAGYKPLSKDHVNAGNIILYACLKGSKDLFDTDFSYTMPYSREQHLQNIANESD